MTPQSCPKFGLQTQILGLRYVDTLLHVQGYVRAYDMGSPLVTFLSHKRSFIIATLQSSLYSVRSYSAARTSPHHSTNIAIALTTREP